ncbi:TetR/AcrR family transcriptional regulator [Plantibacter sp. Mn2098]|uniref:TetR/AcrR family transcriptional regulator n=1 Tax=Plantibacter sp. Mn2098 TaxID=3395266 RepID=UPI003BCBD6CF
MNETTDRVAGLTAKGRATRERIVEAAAELMHAEGFQGATNEEVRAAAAISGSQLGHYFPDKESLVRAVIAHRADQVVVIGRAPVSPGEGGTVAAGARGAPGVPGAPGDGLALLDSISRLRQWADFYLEREEVCLTGCRFGSLASDVLKSDLDVRDDISTGFSRWADVFRDGLAAMRDRGELRADAEPERLAYVLLAAFQGGMLLTQAQRSIAPLRASLGGAIDYIATFLHPSDPTAPSTSIAPSNSITPSNPT